MDAPPNRRILVIDDAPAIHQDFRKLLGDDAAGRDAPGEDLADLEATLFGTPARPRVAGFELDSAYQGQEALAKVSEAVAAQRPYAMAFVDMRMPPGWDGVETIERIWRVDPRMQMVICTAYSDHSWEEILHRLDAVDRLLILKKPFDGIEVCQLAATLTAKWRATRQATSKLHHLERVVAERTAELRDANQSLRNDLAERKRAAAELSLAASVFHHALDGIVIADPRGRVISVNPAFTAITGHEPAEVLGQSIARLWGRSGAPGAYRAMRDGLAQHGRWEGEVGNRRRNGEEFLIRLSVSRVDDNELSSGSFVAVLHDITDLRRKEEYIRHLAFHDQLTGLPNQALLVDRLNESIAVARRDGEPLGLMFIDLDQFKAVNDSYGHDVGNDLLREIAVRLKGCLRESDTVARIGGDEFVVVPRQVANPTGYAGLAQKIITCLSEPIRIAGRVMQVGASIGIACHPDDGSDAIELMKHADAAMYAAKAAGRGGFRFFQAAMTAQAEQRMQLEIQLRCAVRDGELELRYQPKVSMRGGEPRGVEALIRWRHGRRGLLAPAAFLPIAEESGLICDLGDWVLQEVFRQSSAWRLRGLGRLPIAVNVSAKQVQRGDLVEKIVNLAGRYGVPPADLEIELTESCIMADPDAVSAVLRRLRELGVRIAVDDFGTGYSSLAYLRRLPIDILKIDGSFIANADRTPSDAQIVRTIVALGQGLNLTVVAEGVETDDQAEFLRSCGCEAAQGYLFARPLTAEQLEMWICQAAARSTGQRKAS